MAITTAAELATAAANWLARADLTSRIPEFISLAEAKFNRALRTRDMETKNATFSITGEYVAVPSGFLEVKSFYLNTSPKRALNYLPDDTQTDYYGVGTGTPSFFCLVGTNFRFGKVPDATYSSTLVYYTALTTLSGGGSTTNWLITNHPDLYLYGVCLEAQPYLGDDQRLVSWQAGYQQTLASVQAADNRSRWGGNGMAVRVA